MNFGLGDFDLTLNFLRNVSSTGKSLSETLERLSSGVKVSSALDEGGSAIVQLSGAYKRDSAVLAQAASNITQSLSQLSTADAALAEAETTLKRMDELAAAVEGGASGDQLTAIQTEFNNLKSSYNDIINNTELPTTSATEGQNVFAEGGNHDLSTQAGYGANNTIDYTVGELLDATVTVTTAGATATHGDGTFTLTSTGDVATSGSDVKSTAVGDFDEDGHLDVVIGLDTIGMPGMDDGIYIMYGNGDGTFQASTTLTLSAMGHVYGQVYDVAATDIDNDNDLDIIFSTDAGGGTTSVVYGNGNGTFASPVTIASSGQTFQFEDLNGDGYEDLVSQGAGGGSSLYVRLGNADGTFQAELDVNFGSATVDAGDQSIAFGTLNSGTAVDMAAASNAGIITRMGNADGTFAAHTTIGVAGDNYTSVAIADVDGDGTNDIVAINNDENRIETYIGNGDGTYEAVITYHDAALTTQPSYFQLKDLDGDSDLDIVVESDSVFSLTNDGSGTFSTKSTITTVSQLTNTVIADFDEDGVTSDIFAMTSDSNSRVYGVFTADTTESFVPGSSTTSTQRTFESGDTVDSVSDATDVRSLISGMLAAVDNEQGNVNALQTRLNSTVNILAKTSQNFQTASDRITSIDVATELGNFIAQSIVSDNQTAIAAQITNLNLSAVELLKNSFKQEST